MNQAKLLLSVPVLASLNVDETIEFYTKKLRFELAYRAPEGYLIMRRDDIEIHFWPCDEQRIAENTACRIKVDDASALFDELKSHSIIHPNASLEDREWGNREFAIIDSHGNLITFYEELK